MRIGIFGGSFDPVHWGHLILAEQCREQAQLDQVWFLPAAHHPFKAQANVATFDERVAMLRLAIEGVAGFEISEIERGLPAPTYTVQVLDAIAALHPKDEWFFLVGGDALAELPTWHEPAQIAARATLVAMARPGHPIPDAATFRQKLRLKSADPFSLQVVDVPLIDLSSRDIRRRIGDGRSIRFMLPWSVERYIHDRGLYAAPGR